MVGEEALLPTARAAAPQAAIAPSRGVLDAVPAPLVAVAPRSVKPSGAVRAAAEVAAKPPIGADQKDMVRAMGEAGAAEEKRRLLTRNCHHRHRRRRIQTATARAAAAVVLSVGVAPQGVAL